LQQRKEIVRLEGIGVLEEDYSSEWAFIFPSFAIPKENGEATIRTVVNFRNLNLLLKHRMSPIPYSKDHHIKLDYDADAQKPFPIVFPWFIRKTNTSAYTWVSRLPGS
jgi:hypothetical protein